MTSWEPLDDEEQTQYQERVQSAQAEDEKNGVCMANDVPQVVGNKNVNKFCPHVGHFRAGALSNVTELVNMF